jgi:peptide-methionine (S)-S-oxide reductase
MLKTLSRSPQLRFLQYRGVVRCVVGYTGGQAPDPTYRHMQDHTEALLLEFDPEVISYEDLLQHWSRMHSPVRKTKCQYRSAVWYTNAKQQVLAEAHLAAVKERVGGVIHSAVEAATKFYRAEEYHQNFITKQQF